MSSQTPDFSKGASGPASVYDNTPSGLGISPAYLAGGSTASASAQATLTSSIVTGTIPAAGTTPTNGTGFTYTHTNGTGVYAFTFATAFSAAPNVQVTIVAALGTLVRASLSALTATGFTVNVANDGSAGTDAGFTFIALPTV